MTLKMVLTQDDLIAAVAAWVASNQGGSQFGVTHQMDATTKPISQPGGGLEVNLNF